MRYDGVFESSAKRGVIFRLLEAVMSIKVPVERAPQAVGDR